MPRPPISPRSLARRLATRPAIVATSAFVLLGSAGAVAFTHQAPAVATAPAPHRVALTVAPVPVAPVQPPVVVPPASTPVPAVSANLVIGPAPSRPVVHAVRAALAVKPSPPPAPAPAPVSHSNYLSSDDGTLNTSVGIYSDCSGNSVLSPQASILTCITGRLYFAGHNYGVFTPLIHMEAGAGITYWDGSGRSHHFRVVSVRPSWSPSAGVPPITQSNVVAQFQTCSQPDGSIDRILDATLDGGSPLGNLIAPVVAPVATTVSTAGTTMTTTTTTTTNTLFWNLFGGGHH